jgi:hypothetical protein
MHRLLIVLAVVLAAAGQAHAQGLTTGVAGFDPSDAINPIALVEGPGVKVGEGTVIHPQVGVEAGVVSNVFYTDQNPTASALVRVIGEVGVGSLTPQRLSQLEHSQGGSDPNGTGAQDIGILQYRADLRLSYDYYPSDDSDVSNQGGFGVAFSTRGIVNPLQPLRFIFLETYQRLLRPTNFESNTNTDRDINDLQLQLQYAPTGRSVNAILHYETLVDVFEAQSQQFANRFQNTIGVRVNWRWLPQTFVFGDVSQGDFTGIGSSEKVTSYPLTALVGLQTLLTPAFTFNGYGGYTNGFYQSGPSFSSAIADIQLGYRYVPEGRLAFQYNYNHQDSINANYYRDNEFLLYIDHDFVNALNIFATGGVILREYNGIINTLMPTMYTNGVRDDVIYTFTLEGRYAFRDWLAASLSYTFTDDTTNFTYMTDGVTLNPSYVRHEVLAGVRAAF